MQKDTKERPLHFYVANLGSEVQRIFSWKEKGDKEAMENASQRALSIIATIKDFGNLNASAEMDILENSLHYLVENTDNSSSLKKELASYFYPFAMRVVRESLK